MQTRLEPQVNLTIINERLRVRDETSEPRTRRKARAEAIIAALPVADRVALRYRGKDEPLEDLRQVARLGLIKAVDGFDSARGFPFLAYAIPTITGEVKRYFRDKCWAIKPPRQLQETLLKLRKAQAVLEQRLHASPSVAEMAAELGASAREIEDALRSDGCYRLESVQGTFPGEEGSTSPPRETREGDASRAEWRLMLLELLSDESQQIRDIVYLRYFRDLTQTQIAARVGVSQMQISRSLNAVLRRMGHRAREDGYALAET